jgi:hypothetical protein
MLILVSIAVSRLVLMAGDAFRTHGEQVRLNAEPKKVPFNRAGPSSV